ncbi:sucrose synthase [Candidatus Margulisiibacteriota bacterium]
MQSTLPIEIERIEKEVLLKFLNLLKHLSKSHILRNELINFFNELRPKTELAFDVSKKLYVYRFLKKVQEMIIVENSFLFVYRYRIAKYEYYEINFDKNIWFKPISIEDYLHNKDYVLTGQKADTHRKAPQIDFLPFYDYSPKIKDSDDIGNGIIYLTKNLASNLFQHPETWNQLLHQFLSGLCLGKQQLLIDCKKIKSLEVLIERLDFIMDLAESTATKTEQKDFFKDLKLLGFKPGWGDSIDRIAETMKLLKTCINSPDAKTLENFISRIPLISKVAIISPHGWFGQEKVLGKPDTGGQVVYILDQVKYLEKKIAKNLKSAGLKVKPKVLIVSRLIPENEGTTCDQRLEKVNGSKNCWILRVPFRNKKGDIHPKWVSRFHIWPYLETFTEEAEENLKTEFKSYPDLIIGNYSDGNLVATLLAQKCNAIQCNIAHALEKSKYMFSDINWETLEKNYNFSFQYTADLVAMNLTSFIITSTFQEIGGTQEVQGQYETYLSYSMPNLYHVKRGINLFHPKFNVIPPGVPENVFFSYALTNKRKDKITKNMEKTVFLKQGDFVIGKLEHPDKIPIFSMARIDKVKNLSGLIELFATNQDLRKIANLIIISDKIDIKQSQYEEEQHEIEKIYKLIEEHDLKKDFRWVAIGATASRDELAEVYRIMAERKGVFVQPALFEAFGLTVIEAMASGLPTFATSFGGPSEIIQDNVNGFLINPTTPARVATKILSFIKKSQKNPAVWEDISKNSIKRVAEKYNWNLYSERLLTLSRLYSFWKFAVSMREKLKMRLYCDMIFDDFFRKRLPEEY